MYFIRDISTMRYVALQREKEFIVYRKRNERSVHTIDPKAFMTISEVADVFTYAHAKE